MKSRIQYSTKKKLKTCYFIAQLIRPPTTANIYGNEFQNENAIISYHNWVNKQQKKMILIML